MTLKQEDDRVSGHYAMGAARCTLAGRVAGRKLTFTYQEPDAEGEGFFELSGDGKRLQGKWRQQGDDQWREWRGHRAPPDAPGNRFEGLWQSSFGKLRLVASGNDVVGCYDYAGGSTITGNVAGDKLTFRYQEPTAQGEGWFQLSPDGDRFLGKWRAAGTEQWSEWSAQRIRPAQRQVWLIVLEARWESGLAQREYSFGSMLRAFFNRLPHVQTRHRIFNNQRGLRKWCRELAYLAEPVVLVIASHGTGKGLQVGRETIGPEGIVDALRYAGDVKLLHFSSCQIMQSDAAQRVHQGLAGRLPISGYKTSVDWATSAIIEFAYLDLMLAKGMPPAEAAEQLVRIVPLAGDRPVGGTALRPAGFRFLPSD